MKEDFKEFILIGGIIMFVFLLLGVLVSIPFIYGSSREARIYNEKHGTHWTTADFFWAGEQINKDISTIKVELQGR